MDIIISDSWLREYLDTKATPRDIAEYVSLCGPSIEQIEEKNGYTLYHIEITTNRIDCASVYGFAREAAAILPRFKVAAKLKPLSPNVNIKTVGNLPFNIVNNNKLVKRTLGVVLTNIKNWKTPAWMQKRLTSCGVRSLNAVVDITNYVMLETGHPTHAFDYDKIKNKKFIVRESKRGEKVTSFDGKTYKLFGGDIVFDDGDGEIIDLPGIIGTKNSAVDKNTKRVFFFIDNNNPSRIRKTSMSLAIRTMAASINEKGVDPELGRTAILRGIELYQKVCGADVASRIFDDYTNHYKEKVIKTSKLFIDKNLGVTIPKDDIEKYLSSLQFKPKWSKDTLSVIVPSFRSDDINIPEDLIEEIARIYGYHNLPSKLMGGNLPDPLYKTPFAFEWKIKNILKALGGVETYTLSLVPGKYVKSVNALNLKNPLGSETEYLRTDLSHSLIEAAINNIGNYEQLFIYEMANVYLPNLNSLPEEKMVLGMCFDGYKFSEVKGVLEALLSDEQKINFNIVKTTESYSFNIEVESSSLGYLKMLDDGMIVSEIDLKGMLSFAKEYESFKTIPTHPPQIENFTVKIPEGTEVGGIIESIKSVSNLVTEIKLSDIYKDAYTFKISYQHPEKTLNDKEVEKIRIKIQNRLKEKFKLNI